MKIITRESEQLNVRRPVRTCKRSDGMCKIYGWSNDGQLCTVVMKPGGRTGYDIWHLKIAGIYRIYCGEVLK